MNSKLTAGLTSGILLVILLGSVLSVDWGVGDINYIGVDSIAMVLFEVFGAVLLVLAMVMFSSIIGGTFLSHEEDDQ